MKQTFIKKDCTDNQVATATPPGHRSEIFKTQKSVKTTDIAKILNAKMKTYVRGMTKL